MCGINQSLGEFHHKGLAVWMTGYYFVVWSNYHSNVIVTGNVKKTMTLRWCHCTVCIVIRSHWHCLIWEEWNNKTQQRQTISFDNFHLCPVSSWSIILWIKVIFLCLIETINSLYFICYQFSKVYKGNVQMTRVFRLSNNIVISTWAMNPCPCISIFCAINRNGLLA